MNAAELREAADFGQRACLLVRSRSWSDEWAVVNLTAATTAARDARALACACVATMAAGLADPGLAVELVLDAAYNLIDAVRIAVPVARARVDVLAALADAAGAAEVAAGTTEVAATCRYVAAIGLARAACAVQPASYDDAMLVLETASRVLSREIVIAGDLGADYCYAALTALQDLVLQVMTTRGASLAALVTVALPQPLPHLVVAQRLYGDPDRADELVQRVDPIHPLFMPVAMQVLGA